jgi:hypothetical protein
MKKNAATKRADAALAKPLCMSDSALVIGSHACCDFLLM